MNKCICPSLMVVHRAWDPCQGIPQVQTDPEIMTFGEEITAYSMNEEQRK